MIPILILSDWENTIIKIIDLKKEKLTSHLKAQILRPMCLVAINMT